NVPVVTIRQEHPDIVAAQLDAISCLYFDFAVFKNNQTAGIWLEVQIVEEVCSGTTCEKARYKRSFAVTRARFYFVQQAKYLSIRGGPFDDAVAAIGHASCGCKAHSGDAVCRRFIVQIHVLRPVVARKLQADLRSPECDVTVRVWNRRINRYPNTFPNFGALAIVGVVAVCAQTHSVNFSKC